MIKNLKFDVTSWYSDVTGLFSGIPELALFHNDLNNQNVTLLICVLFKKCFRSTLVYICTTKNKEKATDLITITLKTINKQIST